MDELFLNISRKMAFHILGKFFSSTETKISYPGYSHLKLRRHIGKIRIKRSGQCDYRLKCTYIHHWKHDTINDK